MKKMPDQEDGLLLRKEAEKLLLSQPAETGNYIPLSVDELRREYRVQQIMLNLQQQKLNDLSAAAEDKSFKISGVVDSSAEVAKQHQINNAGVLENMVDGYMELDENLLCTYANRAIGQITGRPENYWHGKSIWDGFLGGTGMQLRQGVQKAISEKVYVYVEDYYPLPGIWHEYHIYPANKGLSVFVVNATVRKKLEIQLQETCEMGLIGGWETVPGEGRVLLSEICCRALGLAEGNSITVEQAIALFETHTSEGKIIETIITALEKTGSFDKELRVVAFDGHAKWLRCKGHAEYHEGGLQRIKGIIQDISFAKAAKQTIEENEDRFRTFMENIPAAAWICDEHGNYEYVNSQYYKIFHTQQNLAGKNIRDTYPADIATDYLEDNNKVFNQKKAFSTLKSSIRQDGSTGQFFVSKFLLYENSGNAKLGAVAVDITQQVNINEQLASQKHFLKGITDNVPCLISYSTKDLVCTFANKKVGDLLGMPLQDIVGHPLRQMLGEEEFARLYPYILQALDGNAVQWERAGLDRQGNPVYIWIQHVPDIEDGMVKGFYSLITDITELKKTQQAIAFEERDKEALINSSKDYICSLDKDLKIITANAAYKNLMLQVTGKPVLKGDDVRTGSGFDDATWQLWGGFFRRALAGEYFTVETCTKPEGVDWELWTECTFNPIIQNGEVTGLACYSHDVTDRKKAAEALKNSEEKFRALVHNIGDVIALIDETGIIKYVSSSVTAIMGYEETELLGRNMFEIIHPDDHAVAFAELQKALPVPGYNTTIEIRLLHKTGIYIFIEARGCNQLHNPLLKALLINCRDITERKIAEQTIAESYKNLEDYRFALDQSNMVFIADEQGNISYVNNNFCTLSKYSFEELIGNKLSMLNSAYHPPAFFENLWQTTKRGQVWRGQIKNKAKDGTYYWINSTVIPFVDTTGKPYQFLGIDTDITQAKAAEEALQASNERFKYVAEAAFDAIWDWDIENKTMFWGEGYKTLFGYEAGLLPYEPERDFYDKVHPDDLDIIFKSAETIKTSPYWFVNYRFRKANNEYAYVADRAAIIRDETGKRIRMIGAMQDVTERTRAVKELEQSELKFRSMVFNINDIVMLADEEGYLTYASPAIKTILGYEFEEVLGMKIFKLVHPHDYQSVKQAFNIALANDGESGIMELRYRHKNGHYIFVESQGNNQLRNPAINAVILTSRDITKRKEREEEKMQLVYELMEKNADLKQFSYITSHNLRAPLTNLMAICSLLDTAGLSQQETTELINAFKVSTAKLSDTLDDLIKILIIKDGKSQEIEQVYFEKILAEVKSSVSTMIETSGAVIHADFSAAPSVSFYSTYMESILLNLLTNAIRYAQPGRRPVIAIQTKDEEKFIVFTFMDNGRGMDMHRVKSKIFGLYQRFHHNIEGKGIGLYLVHSQVTALGGSITVDSREGEGTTFVIRFKKELFKGRR